MNTKTNKQYEYNCMKTTPEMNNKNKSSCYRQYINDQYNMTQNNLNIFKEKKIYHNSS